MITLPDDDSNDKTSAIAKSYADYDADGEMAEFSQQKVALSA